MGCTASKPKTKDTAPPAPRPVPEGASASKPTVSKPTEPRHPAKPTSNAGAPHTNGGLPLSALQANGAHQQQDLSQQASSESLHYQQQQQQQQQLPVRPASAAALAGPPAETIATSPQASFSPAHGQAEAAQHERSGQGAPVMDPTPPRLPTSDPVPSASHPVASFHPLSPPMLSIGSLSAGGLVSPRPEGALYTGVLASQPMRPQEGSSAVGESGELMLPYPAPYVPTPSMPAPDYPSLPCDNHWQPRRRRAVLIGCNYVQSPAISQLQGCINDMRCMRELLMVNFGFQPQDMIVLNDMEPDPEYIPTKGNVLAAAEWLAADCQPYDSLVFFFSGYGGQLIEAGDHDHPYGDTLLPVDHAEVGHITAEELEGVMLRQLPPGVRLHAIIDASPAPCPIRLPCSVSIQPNGWGTWMGVRAARALPRRVSKVPGTESVDAAFQVSPLNPIDRSHTATTAGGEALLFSSSWSEDGPPDAQTMSTVKSTGAMAYCFIQAVQLGHSQTYNTLIRAMRYALKNGPQHFGEMPRLTSTLEFNLNRNFML